MSEDRKKNLHEGHRARMKERYENDLLLMSFSEHEILEMLLFYCIPRVNTNELAHSLLRRFGSLDRVLSCPPDELAKTKLVSRQTAVSLRFFYSLGGYLQRGNPRKRISVDSLRDLKEYVFCRFKEDTKEQVRLFGINPLREIAACTLVGRGTSSMVAFDVGAVAEAAAGMGFKDVILAHNHPFSDPAPSDSDITATGKLNIKLNDIGIHLLDHLIVGQAEVFSFREKGFISDVI